MKSQRSQSSMKRSQSSMKRSQSSMKSQRAILYLDRTQLKACTLLEKKTMYNKLNWNTKDFNTNMKAPRQIFYVFMLHTFFIGSQYFSIYCFNLVKLSWYQKSDSSNILTAYSSSSLDFDQTIHLKIVKMSSFLLEQPLDNFFTQRSQDCFL